LLDCPRRREPSLTHGESVALKEARQSREGHRASASWGTLARELPTRAGVLTSQDACCSVCSVVQMPREKLTGKYQTLSGQQREQIMDIKEAAHSSRARGRLSISPAWSALIHCFTLPIQHAQ
jgi:hypothetical protein